MARDGSAVAVKRTQRALASRRRRERAPLRRPGDLRGRVEELLRVVAFVLHATRAVRQAMVPTADPGA